MARHLDLEEQEQLDELKHFWNQWGNLITWFLIGVFGAFAAWNGWNYWQRTEAIKASALYDEVERAATAGDAGRVDQAVKDLQDKYGRTAYAQQGSLLAARFFTEQAKPDQATAALKWAAEEAKDEGLQAVARLRLASVLVEGKAYDDALKQLGAMPKEFEALAADRRGDIFKLQGKKEEAKAEYLKAWKGFEAGTEYRGLVEVKLTALGVDVQALKAPAESAKS
ncbi:MAG TPA: tetratricopeptide repeat protein [Ramlibacter sp.]|uniref:YfgM family protein n=1 Tax=Ramlibacter sp. TaxID=1917967 RepID=UPI002ED43CE4